MNIRTNLTEKDVTHIFDTYKKDMGIAISQGNYERAAHLIESAAQWGYAYNFKYMDEGLEEGLHTIGKTLLIEGGDYVSKDQKIAFICNRVADNCELVQQYARALNANGFPFLMIIINRSSSVGYSAILDELKNFPSASIIFVEDNSNYLETSKKIVELVRDYKPSKLLLHAWPWDVRIWLAVAALPLLPCYNICFNDHTFWIGASLLDYNIEFRPFGEAISLEKRKLRAGQLFYLPYYPILSKDIPFEGLSYDLDGKVIIFTGGTYYKMLGKKNLFFQMMDRILEENQNAVVLLASGQQDEIKQRIAKMKNSQRIYLTGFRRDIYALFDHCDIFMGTYPCSGGLMSQYAATLGKPIIAYTDKNMALDDVDGIVNYNDNTPIAYNTLDEVCKYANRLCQDENFRRSEGERLKRTVISREQFEKVLGSILKGESHPTPRTEYPSIDYEEIRKFYLYFHNRYSSGQLLSLLANYRFGAFSRFPQYSFIFVIFMLRIIKKKLVNRMKSLL